MLWRMWWFIVVTLSAAVSLRRLSPPRHDAGGFSTDNALKHLRFIASEGHPVGSPFHDQVRDYVVQQFRNLGYDVQTQNTVWHDVALSNVIARKLGQSADHKAV